MENEQLMLELIKAQGNEIGKLTSEKLELSIRLMQALETADVLAKELEAKENGDTEQPNEAGTADSSTERVQQG